MQMILSFLSSSFFISPLCIQHLNHISFLIEYIVFMFAIKKNSDHFTFPHTHICWFYMWNMMLLLSHIILPLGNLYRLCSIKSFSLSAISTLSYCSLNMLHFSLLVAVFCEGSTMTPQRQLACHCYSKAGGIREAFLFKRNLIGRKCWYAISVRSH